MISAAKMTKGGSMKQVMLLELFIAALLPVAALLILAVIGTPLISTAQAGPFILAFTLCALVSSGGIFCIILQMQHMVKRRVMTLIGACQEYRAGQKLTRAPMYGRDEFDQLAGEINALFQMSSETAPTPAYARPQAGADTSASNSGPLPSTQPIVETHLRRQLEQLLQEISPVMDGDLRVRARARAEGIGTIADTVNYLVEELIHLNKQIRSAANHILSATRDLLDRSIELAQTTEAQLQLLSGTTEQIEKLVAFTQRLTRSITISADAAAAIQQQLEQGEITFRALAARTSHFQRMVEAMQMTDYEENRGDDNNGEEGHDVSFTITPRTQQRLLHDVLEMQSFLAKLYLPENAGRDTQGVEQQEEVLSIFSRLSAEAQRQRQLLATVEQSTEERVTAAEEVISELYALAQRIHQASMGVMNAAERISSLAVLANEWRASTANIRLPDDDGADKVYIDEDLGSFTPSHT